MKEELIIFIFIFLVGTTVVNFGIAVAARIKSKHKEFNNLVLYWTALFATYLAAAVLNKNTTQIAFAYFTHFLPTFIIAQILCNSRDLPFKWKDYLSIHFIGATISAYMLLRTDFGFTLSLLPVTFTTTLPYWRPIWNSLVTHRATSNWIEKTMSLVFITGLVNHFNYAFFRLDASAAVWGWSISITQYQCLSIFLPLLISHRQEEKERKNLKLTLEKISGKNTNSPQKIDELYEQLEIQISAKENALTQLRASNLNLEEERKINEILIKTISHDIANPLTVVKVYMDMIQSNRIPEEDYGKILERVNSNIKNAFDMISRIKNAILNRSQASLGAIENVDLNSALQNTHQMFEGRLAQKDLKLVIKNTTPENTLVLAEKSALVDHIFSNIISNAIKFSYTGQTIEMSASETEDGCIRIEIRDYGTGIQADILNQNKLQSIPGTMGEAGTGFGLVVMGYFLRKFGATSEIISHQSENKGTSVILKFKKGQSVVGPRHPEPFLSDAHFFS